MELAARIGTMARRGAPLPYDAEVEWLENTVYGWNEGPYINLGVYAYPEVRIEAEINPITSATPYYAYGYFGAQNGSGSRSFSFYSDNSSTLQVIDFSNSIVSSPIDGYGFSFHKIILDPLAHNKAIIDDVPYSFKYYNSGQTLIPLFLFARNRNGVVSSARCRIKMFKYGNLLDLIPVRITNEDGVSEGAMYNRLGVGGINSDGSLRTDGLYRNCGTSSFGWKELDGTIVLPT